MENDIRGVSGETRGSGDSGADSAPGSAAREAEPMLPERDVRAIVRLLSTVAASTGGPIELRRKLAEGLAELVEATGWIWTISRGMLSGTPMTVQFLHSDMTDEQITAIMEGSQDQANPPPENVPLLEEYARGHHFTRTRQQMVDDKTWYESEHVKRHRRRCDLDHFIFSIYPLTRDGDPDLMSAVGLHRGFGQEPFTDRDRRLVHIVLSEIGWLHGESSRRVPDLSPRQRTVFGLLIEGLTRRRIAEQLAISEHTVNDHVKAIYRHFEVASHAELMRRFMTGDGGDGGTTLARRAEQEKRRTGEQESR